MLLSGKFLAHRDCLYYTPEMKDFLEYKSLHTSNIFGKGRYDSCYCILSDEKNLWSEILI